MQASFKIFNSRAAQSGWLCGLGLFCLAGANAPGRPIEFSEPSGSNVTSHVSRLGAKPADLPGVEDRVFKPHSYSSADGAVYSMKPITAPPAATPSRKNRPPGPFNRDNDWTQLAPEKILLKQMERDALKLPAFDAGDGSSEEWSSWDPYNLKSVRRNGTGKNDARGRGRETKRLDSAADVLTASDPFAPYSGRHTSLDVSQASDLNARRTRGFADLPRGGGEFAPEALERKQQADHLEDFKRTLNFQTPGLNPVLSAPASPQPRGNAFVSDVDNFSRSASGSANPLVAVPVAPVSPRAPLAPGQTSLTPSPYTPPAKLKPTAISAPRRSF